MTNRKVSYGPLRNNNNQEHSIQTKSLMYSHRRWGIFIPKETQHRNLKPRENKDIPIRTRVHPCQLYEEKKKKFNNSVEDNHN